MTRRVGAVLIALWILGGPLHACTLTSAQRKYYLYEAVKLLDPKTAEAARPQSGVFRVKAEHFYDDAKACYIQVKKIYVHEYRTWANELTEWNSGRVDEFELRLNNAEVGKYYQVRVEWEDGSTYTWEYQMKAGGTTVRISEPS